MDYWRDVAADIDDPYSRESYRLDGNHADVEMVLRIDLLRPPQLTMNLAAVAVALAGGRMLQQLQLRHDVMRNTVAPKMFRYSLI